LAVSGPKGTELEEEVPARVKDLDAVVIGIPHIDVVQAVNSHTCRTIKLPIA
jgi:hypothetical protein